MPPVTALASPEDSYQLALRSAIELWSDSTTAETSLRRADLNGDKRTAIKAFFSQIQKLPFDLDSRDVNTWRVELEKRLKPASVYAQISRLSSFYELLMKDARFEGMALRFDLRNGEFNPGRTLSHE
jgi:hypothetical protein